MTGYDLCLAWNWEYDSDFVAILDRVCQSERLSLLQVTPDNLGNSLAGLARNEISFKAFFDRASEADPRFMPFVEWAQHHPVYWINPHERASHAWNKAAMHLEFISAGLETPYTIILPSYNEQPFLQAVDLSWLGKRFTIKPAHGGGGVGVVMEATSIDQVLSARKEFPSDLYLLQAHIIPAELGGRPAWFRSIYCAGKVYPCWWDITSHVYTALGTEDERTLGLSMLRQITSSIARICGLEFFSTEIAVTAHNLFVVVDYVNDQIDLRLQSKAFDGVPDNIVQDIAWRLASLVASHL